MENRELPPQHDILGIDAPARLEYDRKVLENKISTYESDEANRNRIMAILTNLEAEEDTINVDHYDEVMKKFNDDNPLSKPYAKFPVLLKNGRTFKIYYDREGHINIGWSNKE